MGRETEGVRSTVSARLSELPASTIATPLAKHRIREQKSREKSFNMGFLRGRSTSTGLKGRSTSEPANFDVKFGQPDVTANLNRIAGKNDEVDSGEWAVTE